MTREHLLRTIADPDGTLPEVTLEYAGRSNNQATYAAFNGGRQIGTMKLGAPDTGEPFMVQGSNVDERLKGRGYGLAMYLGAAALAYESRRSLNSDVMVSRDAARLWARLERRGLARIGEPFQWRGRVDYSHKGFARFVPLDQLPQPDLVPAAADYDDIWENM